MIDIILREEEELNVVKISEKLVLARGNHGGRKGKRSLCRVAVERSGYPLVR